MCPELLCPELLQAPNTQRHAQLTNVNKICASLHPQALLPEPWGDAAGTGNYRIPCVPLDTVILLCYEAHLLDNHTEFTDISAAFNRAIYDRNSQGIMPHHMPQTLQQLQQQQQSALSASTPQPLSSLVANGKEAPNGELPSMGLVSCEEMLQLLCYLIQDRCVCADCCPMSMVLRAGSTFL